MASVKPAHPPCLRVHFPNLALLPSPQVDDSLDASCGACIGLGHLCIRTGLGTSVTVPALRHAPVAWCLAPPAHGPCTKPCRCAPATCFQLYCQLDSPFVPSSINPFERSCARRAPRAALARHLSYCVGTPPRRARYGCQSLPRAAPGAACAAPFLAARGWWLPSPIPPGIGWRAHGDMSRRVRVRPLTCPLDPSLTDALHRARPAWL